MTAVRVQAADLTPESTGLRYGFPVTANAEAFKEVDAFANWRLPWRWDLGKEWYVQTRLDLSLGWVADSHVSSFIGTLGPSFVLGQGKFPVTFLVGSSPTILSEEKFPSKDLGCKFQFTSHAGLQVELTPHLRLDYRFQHMSNAGLGDHNPGLNLHVFGLSYVF